MSDPGARGRPVIDAPAGAVVASFGASSWFAWPLLPTVWTAPRPGILAFGVNAPIGQALQRPATVVLVPLGLPGSAAQQAFAPPAVTLERVADGLLVRYEDRSGFGLVPESLRALITTNRGVRYTLAAWVGPGPRETFLPLPPPDLPLPPGVHSLSVTIEDRLGNAASPATIVFDTP